MLLLISCPPAATAFTSDLELTLAEQIDEADVVALVEWVATSKGRDGEQTQFTVKRVAKGDILKRGQSHTVGRLRKGKLGDLYLLQGLKEKDGDIAWWLPKTSRAAFEYAVRAPAPKLASKKRLVYYSAYLENGDELVAKDAHLEFAAAEIADYREISKSLPKDELLEWVLDDKKKSLRRLTYGVLLGFCGDEATAAALKTKILEDSDVNFRVGMDGVMSGYLMLTGEDGLKVLEKHKFQKGIALSEIYFALQAVRFMWKHGEGKIPNERLRQSVRLLLAHSEFVDLIIADLTWMEDWSSLDRIVGMYDDATATDESLIRAKRTAIVRYLAVCSREAKFDFKDKEKLTTEISKKAKQHLAELRKSDPKTVQRAFRFLFKQ